MPPFDWGISFGDSIVAGIGASDLFHDWSTLLGVSTNMTVYRQGITSTTLQNTVQNSVATIGGAVTNNGRDTYTTRVTPYRPNYVFILYGLNDLRLNDAAFTSALFQNDLGETVQGLIDSGIQADRIVIGSPPYILASSYSLYAPFDGATAQKFTDYIVACQEIANAKGTRFINVYQYMADHGGDSLIGADGIHPNDAGHQVIADAFLSVL